MERIWNSISRILDRSIDYLAIIGYALHNIFLAMAIDSHTSRLASYFENVTAVSAVWLLVPLMLGLILSACLFLRWQTRVLGTIPLLMTAIATIVVYVATDAPMRTIFGIAGLYYSLAMMPFVLIVVYGRLNDVMKKANELTKLNQEQNAKIRKLEANFETGQR